MDSRWRHRHGRLGRIAPRRHRREGPGNQSLQAQPEATVLPDQHLQFLAITAEKDEAVTRIGLVSQLMLNHAGQRIDPAAHILGRTCHVDPSNRGEAQHRLLLCQAKAAVSKAVAKSAGKPAVNVQRNPLSVVIVIRCRRRRPRRGGALIRISMKPEDIPPSWSNQPVKRPARRTDTPLFIHVSKTSNRCFGVSCGWTRVGQPARLSDRGWERQDGDRSAIPLAHDPGQ
jgi:hypothetical protein